MIDTLFLGINALLLMLVWHFGWRRTALDTCRDHLFDLREQVRDHFLAHGIPLSHPAYKQLRDMLNGYLRYTEDATLISFVCRTAHLMDDTELCEALRVQSQARYSTFDEPTRKFADTIRRQAGEAMLVYMASTAPIFLGGLITFFIGWTVYALVRHVVHTISSLRQNLHPAFQSWSVLRQAISRLGRRTWRSSAFLLAGVAIAGPAHAKDAKILEALEVCSFQSLPSQSQ